jgi:hypothetical protein
VRGLAAPLALVAARARRRPGRWLLPALGVALAAAFAGAVAVQATVAGDQSARSVLVGLSPLARTVRVTWQGVVTGPVKRQAQDLLRGLGLGGRTEVVLLNPVRLNDTLVRPAALAPLGRWLGSGSPAPPGPCTRRDCPMLIAGAAPRHTLTAAGVRISIVGSARLPSAVPLGFSAVGGANERPPLLLTGDVDGLDSLAGLSGVYRSHNWLAPLPTSSLHSWQLSAVRARLLRAQAALLSSGSMFSLSAPFDGLDEARAQADAAPRRLLLAGGGALAAFALFIVLAAGALRRDQRADVERLATAGARTGQCLVFVVAESAWLCAVALLAGACLALVAAVAIASAAGVPVGAVLVHSLVTPAGAIALVAGWVAATALLSVSLLGAGGRAADLLAAAAVAAVAITLLTGAGDGDQLPVLLAPLCCVAAGVITYRAVAVLLRGAERVARSGPLPVRLALVGLARAPAAPSLAIAFVAVSVGLGGFALAYRATLLRGTADQAAQAVPLDATVSPAADFATPLELAPLARWRSLARGGVLPVRRTDATYASGGGTVTVPALGVPASGLALIHGWRDSDGSAPLGTLAQRLAPRGPTRASGPRLPPGTRSLSVRVASPALAVGLAADLRNSAGAVTQVALGSAREHAAALRGRVPRGSWELEAFELDEPTGLEATNGHQNAENAGAATQVRATVRIGPLVALGRAGRILGRVGLGAWRGVGAASSAARGVVGAARPAPGGGVARSAPRGGGVAEVSFLESGQPGLLRPAQPSDVRPVPVLVDPQTAASAAAGGRLALTVDGLPVKAQVVGVLRRFPTVPAGTAGFVIADEATLAGALDAQLPGQGRADELWISTVHPGPLRSALATEPLARLNRSFRADVEHHLRGTPVARGVLGTLVAATGLAAALAVLGLLVTLLGAARDERVQRDLVVQGMGPRALRRELQLRVLLAGALGTLVGLVIAVLLTRLAVASVRAAATVAVPQPPLVTVAPWGHLVAWGLLAIAALAATSWVASR